ncbi:hypothetical protein H4R19_006149 [Coemansia spiralis]|nr:hypothetical protein H4R19_006149 [Coemansia spiralis]
MVSAWGECLPSQPPNTTTSSPPNRPDSLPMKLTIALSIVAAATGVAAQTAPPTLHVFGDALSSLGAVSQLVPGITLPSVPVWSDFLAPLLGAQLANTGIGSALPLNPLGIVSSQDQINFFQAIRPLLAQAASHSGDFAVLETGANAVIAQLLSAAPSATTPEAFATALATATVKQLEQLRKLGFRNFIVPSLMDIQSTPLAQQLVAAAASTPAGRQLMAAAATLPVAQYNQALSQQVAAWTRSATGLGTVALVPVGEFVNTILQSPPVWQALGLTDVQAACIAGNGANFVLSSNVAASVQQLVTGALTGTLCDSPSTHFFLDGIHFGERVQRLLAFFVQRLVDAARSGQTFEPTAANLLTLISALNLASPAAALAQA